MESMHYHKSIKTMCAYRFRRKNEPIYLEKKYERIKWRLVKQRALSWLLAVFFCP